MMERSTGLEGLGVVELASMGTLGSTTIEVVAEEPLRVLTGELGGRILNGDSATVAAETGCSTALREGVACEEEEVEAWRRGTGWLSSVGMGVQVMASPATVRKM